MAGPDEFVTLWHEIAEARKALEIFRRIRAEIRATSSASMEVIAHTRELLRNYDKLYIRPEVAAPGKKEAGYEKLPVRP